MKMAQALTLLPSFYRAPWFWIALSIALFAAALFFFARRARQFGRNEALQHAFSRQLIASQEKERKRIAAELHDSLGQRLLVIRNLALLQAQALQTLGVDSARINEISEEASRALTEVREISYALRPYQLDRLGLTKAIEAVIATAAAASQTKFTAKLENIDTLFPEESRIMFYRIVQEALTNIIKHAEATEAVVSIYHEADTLLLTIADNGKGFSPGLTTNSQKGGFGLIGISERVEFLHGRMGTYSVPGYGASLRIEFDLTGSSHG